MGDVAHVCALSSRTNSRVVAKRYRDHRPLVQPPVRGAGLSRPDPPARNTVYRGVSAILVIAKN